MKKKTKRILWVIPLLFILAFFPLLFEKKEEFSMNEELQYEDLIKEAADKHKVDPFLLAAVARVESSWNKDAYSETGAKGLMQLMPETAQYIGEKREIFFEEDRRGDPAVSLDFGAYYLRELYDKFGTWELALAAYNAGPGHVESWLKDENLAKGNRLIRIPFEETANYVEKVQLYKRYYKQRYGSFPGK